ncbi:leucine zipper protein 1-like [Papaver somniferum]|uniref:leucine zipper protein 1-like n=1 Tax=Papaver somniferum TaxID=3469 RepID=UPI000E703CB5|nr:leucine zipper protein 1-like [Papaver somniferum]
MPDEYELPDVGILKDHKETGITAYPALKQPAAESTKGRKRREHPIPPPPFQPQPLQSRATSYAKVADPPVHLEVKRSEKLAKDPSTGEKKKQITSSTMSNPIFNPDMKFLQNVYVKAREDPAMRSRALESLVTLITDDFIFLESSVMLSASMNLTLQQHAALMNQEVNRHMDNLVETRLVRKKAKKDETLIKFLAKELKEEKEHSSKESQKLVKRLSKSLPSQILSFPLSLLLLFSYVIFRQARCMQRQANVSESAASLEDMRGENLNLMTQNDCYVSENTILNEKVDTLFSQVDRLSIDCSRNEELNHHLHDDNKRLKLELKRVNSSLLTSRNIHLSSIATYKRLEEDYERVINSKSKVVANLRRSRDKVTDLNEEVDRLKTKVELLQAQLDNFSCPKPVNPSYQAKPQGSHKNKGSLIIQSDKDISKSGHGKGWDNAYPELCVRLQDSYLKIFKMDHLYTDIQETLNTTLLHLEDSEERYKSQVLRLSKERDESRLEASRLQNEVGDLNADLDEMMETSAKVAKIARKNTQNYMVPLFDAYCNEHEIVPGEEDGFSEDGEEQKVVDTKAMEQESKGASASTDAGLGGPRDKIPETTVTDDASPQQ